MKKLKDLIQNQKYQLLLVASLLSIFISISAYIYYKNEAQNIIHTKENELKTLALLKTNIISSSINDEINDALLISKSEFLIDFLLADKEKLVKYLNSLKEQHDYENIFVTSKNGKIIASTPKQDSINPFLISLIKKTVSDKNIYSTDIYFCNIHNKLHIHYLAPFIKDNKVIGVIILGVDPEKNIYPHFKDSPIYYSSLENYIARKDSDSITVVSPLKYKPNAVLKYKYSYNDSISAVVNAVKGTTGIVSAKDYRGVEVVAYVNHIPNTNWYMVTKIDKKELFSNLFSHSYYLITILIVLIISVFSSASFVYSYRQRNLYKSLYFAEQEFKTTLKSIGDAVITTDDNGIVKFLNPIAENLTGWTEEEAKGKQIEEVFNIINEETRKKVEIPVSRVIREGIVVGLANHTLLISKDGKEIPIADSGAPIKDEEGKITGVILVFRDQTKERLARKKIEESEANLNALINNREEAIWSLDEKFNLIICNDYVKNASKAAYNFDLSIGVNLLEILPPHLREIWKPKYEEALSGKKVTFEFSETILGKTCYFNAFLNPIFINGKVKGVTALSIDITEFKQLHLDLQKSEEKYRLISDLVSDYVFSTIIHEDGKLEIDWVAGNFEEITGYTLEDYKAAGGWFAHLHPDSILQDQEDMKKILNNEKVITEVKTIKKDKSIIWVRVFAQPYWDNKQNRVTKIYGAVQNITDRKLSRLALEESENKFSVAFNESPYALSIQDENDIFIDINQAFCDLTGYSKEEVIGKTGSELNLWADPEEAKKIIQIFEQTGSVKNYEFLFRKKNGEIRNGIISASVIYVNCKKADIASAVDITELKEKERKILDQLDELKRWQNVMLDREDRVIELKKEVNELLAKLGEKKKYMDDQNH
ncbi:MAG: PAS domain-containing protein [Stygiobacter sp.]